MAAFQAKYTPDQREAIASAVIDRGASAPRVVELAAAGQLTDSNGAQLEPFTVPANTVRSEARKAKKRRQGKAASDLGKAEPRDAVEALRRRIVTMLDEELGVEERKRKGNRDPERVRQICRAMREAAAIPGLKEPAKTAPGTRRNGKQQGGQTRGGLAGDLLSAHRAQTATSGKGRPRHDHATGPEERAIGAQEAQAQEDETHEEGAEDGGHGSSACGDAAPLLVPAA